MARKTRHELVEDVELMLSIDSPEQILLRLGRSAASVHRALHREGRDDLAAPFGRIAWQDRRQAGYVRPRDRSRPDGARPRGHRTNRAPGESVAAGIDLTPARGPQNATLAA